MARIRLSAREYPALAALSGNQKVRLVLSGRVALRYVGGDDDFADVDVIGAELHREGSEPPPREHPATIMKRMADLQGMINTPKT